MFLDFLLSVFKENLDSEAVIWKDSKYTYKWLFDRINYWRDRIRKENIGSGSVVFIEADFSPNSIALFLALIDEGCIIAPITTAAREKREEFFKIAEGEFLITINSKDEVIIEVLPYKASHDYYLRLRSIGHPGLVVFSSGSTGKSKAAVHDMTKILEKFKVRKRTLRTITFLLYDHLGGVNTMLYILSNGGCLITVKDRTPDGVLSAVEYHKVELLPTSPTFINLIILTEAYKRHDLTSIKTITYGTEPMPEHTLLRLHELFPNVKLQQTYGLSELGVMRSKSKSSDSLWVKIGGEGYQTRVVDGILQIKAESAMLGYLNAPSPFTDDGWFNTDDEVEVEGEYYRILGRRSEIINVGGEKVYPAEVENVIQEIDNIAEVTVYSEKNPIIGNIVCAKVSLIDINVDSKEFVQQIKKHCRSKLKSYKVPVKISIVDQKMYSERFKKSRK